MTTHAPPAPTDLLTLPNGSVLAPESVVLMTIEPSIGGRVLLNVAISVSGLLIVECGSRWAAERLRDEIKERADAMRRKTETCPYAAPANK